MNPLIILLLLALAAQGQTQPQLPPPIKFVWDASTDGASNHVLYFGSGSSNYTTTISNVVGTNYILSNGSWGLTVHANIAEQVGSNVGPMIQPEVTYAFIWTNALVTNPPPPTTNPPAILLNTTTGYRVVPLTN